MARHGFITGVSQRKGLACAELLLRLLEGYCCVPVWLPEASQKPGHQIASGRLYHKPLLERNRKLFSSPVSALLLGDKALEHVCMPIKNCHFFLCSLKRHICLISSALEVGELTATLQLECYMCCPNPRLHREKQAVWDSFLILFHIPGSLVHASVYLSFFCWFDTNVFLVDKRKPLNSSQIELICE